MANSEEISNLEGSTWSFSTNPNVTGTFEFKNDNTASYTTNLDQKVDLFWWQKGNSFWMQQKNGSKGYLSIMEGQLTTDTKGHGRIIVGEQGNGAIYISEFTMTKSSSN